MGESSRKFSLQESLPSGTKAALISALLTIHSSFYHSADRLLLTLHKSFTVTEAEECWGNGAWRFREHCWKVVSVCMLSISVIFAHFPKHHILSFCSCASLCFAMVYEKTAKNDIFVKCTNCWVDGLSAHPDWLLVWTRTHWLRAGCGKSLHPSCPRGLSCWPNPAAGCDSAGRCRALLRYLLLFSEWSPVGINTAHIRYMTWLEGS